MIKKIVLLLIISFMCINYSLLAAAFKQETITLSRNTSLNDALIAIETLTSRYHGKKIYNMAPANPPLGIPLNNVSWQDALSLICTVHGLVQEEKPGLIIIKPPEEDTQEEEKMSIEKRQIKISARVLEIKTNISKSFGIDWSSVINGAVEYSGVIGFSGASKVGTSILTTEGGYSTTGDNTISIDALMSILEENQDGEVLAKPNIYVDSGEKGYIQVGKDFSVKSVDEAGNTVDQFFSTGVILDVTPTIIEDDEGNEAINLVIEVERSSAIPGALSTEITKSKATSSLTIYDGEETAIGGLYDKDETHDRGGVPILKDLPWWCLGLRYLFGYNKTTVTEKELIIVIKAEIIDPILIRKGNR